MLVHTSVITFEEKKTGMIKKVYILMKKPYSLAQGKWLKQIQYFLICKHSTVEEEEKQLGFERYI